MRLARVTLLTKGSTSKDGKIPTKIQSVASSMAGARMPIGGSCAFLFGTCLPIGPSKNTPCTNRIE